LPVRARAVPACASCRVQVGVGPGGGQQRGGRLGWGGAWGQSLLWSALYGGWGDLESDSASRRRGALVCCAGQRASVEGDLRRGRSSSMWVPSGFPARGKRGWRNSCAKVRVGFCLRGRGIARRQCLVLCLLVGALGSSGCAGGRCKERCTGFALAMEAQGKVGGGIYGPGW
jgi:hypothetical protein